MSTTPPTEDAASVVKTVIRDVERSGGTLASAVALGLAGGAGAVYALEHHGLVKARKAAVAGRHKG